MTDKKLPSFDGPGDIRLPPRASPEPDLPAEQAEKTDPGKAVSAGYVKAKFEEVRIEAQKRSWAAGWIAGIGSAAMMVVAAFGIWFKTEASAQEKADKAQAHAVEIADAGADKKLAPVITDVAVLKSEVTNINKRFDTVDGQQAEIIRLLKSRHP